MLGKIIDFFFLKYEGKYYSRLLWKTEIDPNDAPPMYHMGRADYKWVPDKVLVRR